MRARFQSRGIGRSEREIWLESMVELGRRLTAESNVTEPEAVAGDRR